VIGAPVYVGKGLDAEGLSRFQVDLEHNLKALYQEADALVR